MKIYGYEYLMVAVIENFEAIIVMIYLIYLLRFY